MEHSTTPGPECDVLWCPNQATHFDTRAIEFRCDEHKAVQAVGSRRRNGRRVLRRRRPAFQVVGRQERC